jgi:peptide/nickel transport system permease protein
MRTAPGPAAPAARKARGGNAARVLRDALRTTRGRVGAVLFLAVLLLAFVGPFLPGPNPNDFVSAPYAASGGDAGPLGADALGRSVLARLLAGGWQVMVLALAATVFAVLIGAVLGVTAAYRRGRYETFVMRSIDVVLALPQLIFVLLIVSVAGAGVWLILVAVALCQAPQVARVVHGAAQDVCERDFVKAVALWGVPPRTVIRRQVLPNLITPLMVETGLRLSFSIIVISGINFLGFGVHPPNANWGVMINENRLGLASNPWAVLGPAIVLAVLSVGTNTFTDAVARANLGESRGEDAMLSAALGTAVEL